MLTGHISDYSEILKLQKHESWLTELKQKIARSEATLSTYLSYTTPLTPEIVESLGAYNPQFYQEYTDSILKGLSKQIRANSINHVVTTEKDIVKLPNSFLSEFEIYVIRINIEFKNPSDLISQIQSTTNK